MRWWFEVLFSTHVNHVSISPTNGNGPTQGQSFSLSLSESIAISRANVTWVENSTSNHPLIVNSVLSLLHNSKLGISFVSTAIDWFLLRLESFSKFWNAPSLFSVGCQARISSKTVAGIVTLQAIASVTYASLLLSFFFCFFCLVSSETKRRIYFDLRGNYLQCEVEWPIKQNLNIANNKLVNTWTRRIANHNTDKYESEGNGSYIGKELYFSV